jgi:hypothetical protein
MCGWHFTCECHAHISQEIHDFLKRQRRSESPRVYDTLPQLRARALGVCEIRLQAQTSSQELENGKDPAALWLKDPDRHVAQASRDAGDTNVFLSPRCVLFFRSSCF